MKLLPELAITAGGTSRFPQTPSTGPLTRTELPARAAEGAL